ncbi:hypothetical protein N7448_009324 [Penicillium atrosanguineum]|uniref:Uncharacterized protein n=1 Tax=Penicillium atrosanguineum TaxID=1132637 RepID=A0A9W9GLH2_9EURO|nr:hypothetical protein N7448_009324 [Penicillium atrosanguineum]KAJ5321279.1 hypothetical protein N7476_004281 [Penicillium atrosanguineum]
MSDEHVFPSDGNHYIANETVRGSPAERKPPDYEHDVEYVDYSLEWPVKPRIDPVVEEVRKKVKKFHDDLKEMRIRRDELLRKAASTRIPSPLPDLLDRLKANEISTILSTVLSCLATSNFYLGIREARKALEFAQKLDHKKLIARCYYWMGRIEFQRGNISVAHEFFKDAMPCIEDDECAEGDFVEFWFKCTRPGISEEYRKRAVDNHGRRVINKHGATKLSTASRSSLRVKRKYQEPHEFVLRPRPVQTSCDQQAPTTESSKQKSRPVPWLIPDVHNEPYEMPFYLRRRFPGLPEIGWHPDQSHAPLPRNHKFTFRCYPKGLSPRYRPTKIFRPHPLEIIYTEETWRKLRQRFKGKIITMTWLANEMDLYDKIVHKRLNEMRRKHLELRFHQQKQK